MAEQQPVPGPATEPVQKSKTATAERAAKKVGRKVKSACRRVAAVHGFESGILDTTQNLTKQKLRRRERVINTAWYVFLIIMLYIGGSATIGWIVNGGYRWGYKDGQTASTAVVVPVSTPSPIPIIRVEVPEIDRVVSAIEKIAEQPSISPPLPQVVERVVQVPVASVVAVQPPSQQTNAELKNEARKRRLLHRYGL